MPNLLAAIESKSNALSDDKDDVNPLGSNNGLMISSSDSSSGCRSCRCGVMLVSREGRRLRGGVLVFQREKRPLLEELLLLAGMDAVVCISFAVDR